MCVAKLINFHELFLSFLFVVYLCTLSSYIDIFYSVLNELFVVFISTAINVCLRGMSSWGVDDWSSQCGLNQYNSRRFLISVFVDAVGAERNNSCWMLESKPEVSFDFRSFFKKKSVINTTYKYNFASGESYWCVDYIIKISEQSAK